MSGSWRIGRISGIDVYVHFTFVLLIAFVLFSHYTAHGDVREALWGVTFILALFGIVVLHELGHALAARRYGIETRDITLLPIGGVARLDRIPEEPAKELVVALAGPAVNVVLAASIYAGLALGPGLTGIEQSSRVGGSLLNQLFWVNVTLAVFNLLPAFPMDGGRVLRALLAMKLDFVRATQIAASIGQAMAILFAFVGLFFNPFLLFIALFIWLGASQEASMVQMRSAMAGIPVQKAMISDFQVLRQDDGIARAAELIMAGFQQDFPVVNEDGVLVGVLTRSGIARAMAAHGAGARVAQAMDTRFVTASPREMLQCAFQRLTEGDCRTLLVVEGGELVGMVTADKLAEALMIQEALRNDRRRSGARVQDSTVAEAIDPTSRDERHSSAT